MKYLVTGGTGFLGSALVKRLVSQGHEVRVLDNHFRGSESRLGEVKDKVELVTGDIRDSQVVREACRGIERVCHLAFINGTEFFYSKPELVLDVGVKGMINVLDACRACKIKDLVVASSSEVYQLPSQIPTDETVGLSIPDPLNPRYSYAGGKIISELMAINYGRTNFDRVVIFRPHNVYGPQMGWEHVIPQFVLRMKELCASSDGIVRFPIQGTGSETRTFIFVDDFIEGLLKVIDKGKHLNIYHIGTDQEMTIADVAKAVGRFYNHEVEILPGREAAGSTPRRCPNIDKLRSLGFEPRIPFSQGLLKTAQWYDEHADERP